VKKSLLDNLVARETGEHLRDVSYITQVFLDELAKAIASGEPVRLRGFGTFTLTKMRGAPPPHKRFGDVPAKSPDSLIRFRVQFSKSAGLKREVWRTYKEKRNGKVRR